MECDTRDDDRERIHNLRHHHLLGDNSVLRVVLGSQENHFIRYYNQYILCMRVLVLVYL